ncbi:MAG: hypothetical protein OHK0022_20340 [Roseiflexaceae bacterium]
MSTLMHDYDQRSGTNAEQVCLPGARGVSEVLPNVMKRAAALAWHLCWGLVGFAIRTAVNKIFGPRLTRAEIVGQTMLATLQRLGPTYVKLGQILSTRPDIFNESTIRHLASLQDQLPPEPYEQVPMRFKEELGIDIEEAFLEFDPRPIASASVATVYKAILQDGRPVAVKVRRTGIVELIEIDLYLLRLVANALQLIPALRLLPLRQSIDDFGICLMRQTDFRIEAAANRRIQAALASDPHITIPGLIEELCSPSIITMDFIREAKQSRHIKAEAAQSAMLTALQALYRMIFVEGFVHCDMHLGNLHLLDDGCIALLDFGFMAELHDQQRIKFAEFFYAMSINDGPGCADVIVETASFCPPNLRAKAFRAEVSTLVASFSRAKTKDYQVSSFVVRLFDIQRRYGIRGTSDFTMAIMSLLILEGISKRFHPDLDFQSQAGPFIFSAFMLRYKLRSSLANSDSPSLDSARARAYATSDT